MQIKFIVPGPIRTKQRPRCGRYGNFYTPQRTIDFENKVAFSAKVAGMQPMRGNIKITICCEIVMAKDIDNSIKSILDGLKDYFNDNQVVEIHAFKTVVKK